jgi:hypothetical protein
MTVGGMAGIMLGGYFSTLPDNKMAFFILGCLPIALCIAALNLSKEIDSYKINEMLSFREELSRTCKEIGRIRFLPELYGVIILIPISALLKINSYELILYFNQDVKGISI